MRDIFTRQSRAVLERFARSSVLLAFDYDGTLAPIVPNPARARMRRRTRALLESLTALYPVVIISGRAQSDALKRLRPIPVDEVVGNHGIEPWHADESLTVRVARWLPILEARLGRHAGLVVEQKRYSIAVHYRGARGRQAARAVILETAESLRDARVIGGKLVVNILPKDAANKGLALERERQRLRCDTAIYVGDDDTDEDVFALDRPGQLLGIRVGRRVKSAAEYYLRSQSAMDDLLRILLQLRHEGVRGAGGIGGRGQGLGPRRFLSRMPPRMSRKATSRTV
jgi:trehalose 6-phosphate phosphatase